MLDRKQYRLHMKVNLSVQGNRPWGHGGYSEFFFCNDVFEHHTLNGILADHFIRHTILIVYQ